jgi:NADH:ubiquinone oxidoreductase subunit K
MEKSAEKKIEKSVEKKIEKGEKHYSIISILAFILGALGVLLEAQMSKASWIFALIIPLLAVIFGFIGLNQVKENKQMIGSVFAVFGIVLGFFEMFSLLLTYLAIEFKGFFQYLILIFF